MEAIHGRGAETRYGNPRPVARNPRFVATEKPPRKMPIRMMILMAMIKGAAMATILIVLANLQFVQGLITALSSACVSGIFLLVATHMNTKRTVEKIEKVEEIVKEKENE